MAMMYSYTTMTLFDCLKLNPDLLDNLNMDTPERTEAFKTTFIAMYNTKSIGAETVSLFKVWIESKFNEVKRLYNAKLDIYERQLNGDDGVKASRSINEGVANSGNTSVDTTNTLIDIARNSSQTEAPTQKNKNSGGTGYSDSKTRNVYENITGNVNVIEQREKWLNFIRDIYRDMCYEFKDCFVIIYG